MVMANEAETCSGIYIKEEKKKRDNVLYEQYSNQF
jgi:hypothetical protein